MQKKRAKMISPAVSVVVFAAVALFTPGGRGFAATTGVTTVNVSLEQPIEAPRWMYEGKGKAKVKGGALIDLLVEAKRGQIAKDRARCLQALQKALSLGK